MQVQKFGGLPPLKNLERYVTENDSSRVRQKKSGGLWSIIQKVGRVSLPPPQSTFFGRLYFGPYGGWPLKFLHTH